MFIVIFANRVFLQLQRSDVPFRIGPIPLQTGFGEGEPAQPGEGRSPSPGGRLRERSEDGGAQPPRSRGAIASPACGGLDLIG